MPEARADVAIIGAGPGGAAVAAVLAAAGARVVLADRAAFPRDKVCGDGLLPDARKVLAALGVDTSTAAHRVSGIRFRAPGGREGFVGVEAAVWPRSSLDVALVERACSVGAELLEGAELEGFVGSPGGWRAVRLRTARGTMDVEARWFVLATGATPRPRAMAGLTGRARPGGAVRTYAAGVDSDPDALLIHFDRSLPRGYYWAFPVGGGRWNVGCGSFPGGGGGGNLVGAAERFAAAHGAELEGRVRGAPLASWFPRLPVASGNLLAVGDAAGLTRPFSGEGIGTAVASGVLAARELLAGGDAAARYSLALRRRYGREFAAWRLGERLLAYPRVVAALVARVESSSRGRRRVKAVLADRLPTTTVLSPWGIARLLLGR